MVKKKCSLVLGRWVMPAATCFPQSRESMGDHPPQNITPVFVMGEDSNVQHIYENQEEGGAPKADLGTVL